MSIASILLVWSVCGLVALIAIPFTWNAEKIEDFLNPKNIYENTKVNYFGLVCLTILFNILCPVLSIGYWFYWLCTCGRK